MNELDEKLIQIDGGYVLDVATGQGYFVKAYIPKFKDVTQITAIDHSMNVEKMQKKFSNTPIVFKEVGAENMPFPNAYFDTVCISNSLHHMPSLNKTFQEMNRVLKKDGYFIINEMYRDNQSERQLSHVFMHHWKETITNMLDGVPQKKTYTRAEILSFVESLNLSKYDVVDYHYEVVDNSEPIFDYTQEGCKELIEEIDTYLQRIPNSLKYQEVLEEGELLKKRIMEQGFAPASSIFIVGNK